MATENIKIISGTPEDLDVREDNNYSRSRTTAERNDEVIERALDLLLNGQTQPVRAFAPKRPEAKPRVYIGFTRVAAVSRIRTGFQVEKSKVPTEIAASLLTDVPTPPVPEGEEAPPAQVIVRDPAFPLSYTIDSISEEEALVRGIADNFQSNKPNDVDLAVAAKGIQDKFSYTDAKVTRILGVTDPFKIGRVKKLLTLPRDLQEAVQQGKLATATALEIHSATGEVRKRVVQEVLEQLEKGKSPTQAAVRSKIEKTKEAVESEEGGEGSTTPTRRSALTGTSIRSSLEALNAEVSGDDTMPAPYVAVVNAFLRWTKGEITDKTWTRKLDEAFGVPAPTSKVKARKSKSEPEQVAEETPVVVESPSPVA